MVRTCPRPASIDSSDAAPPAATEVVTSSGDRAPPLHGVQALPPSGGDHALGDVPGGETAPDASVETRRTRSRVSLPAAAVGTSIGTRLTRGGVLVRGGGPAVGTLMGTRLTRGGVLVRGGGPPPSRGGRSTKSASRRQVSRSTRGSNPRTAIWDFSTRNRRGQKGGVRHGVCRLQLIQALRKQDAIIRKATATRQHLLKSIDLIGSSSVKLSTDFDSSDYFFCHYANSQRRDTVLIWGFVSYLRN